MKTTLIDKDESIGTEYIFSHKEDIINPEEFAEFMKEINNDTRQYAYEETKHKAADKLMLALLRSLGYTDGCKIFEEMHKWYS